MTDPESSREKQTDNTHREEGEDPVSPPECHRRSCTDPAAFVALERYQEETGHGAVEAEAFLCQEHAAVESPANLDSSYAGYVFRVEPL